MVAAPPKINRAEYYRRLNAGELPADVYLLDGELVKRMPQNSPHAFAVSWLNRALARCYSLEWAVRCQLPMVLADDSEPEPDIVVASGGDSSFRDRHPTPADVRLLIEVADTSAISDRRNKLPRYFAAGIPEVWLVDLTAGFVRKFTPHPDQFFYQEVHLRPGDSAELPGLSEPFVMPAELFTPTL